MGLGLITKTALKAIRLNRTFSYRHGAFLVFKPALLSHAICCTFTTPSPVIECLTAWRCYKAVLKSWHVWKCGHYLLRQKTGTFSPSVLPWTHSHLSHCAVIAKKVQTMKNATLFPRVNVQTKGLIRRCRLLHALIVEI